MQKLKTSSGNHIEISDTNNSQTLSCLLITNTSKELRQKLIDAGKIWQVYNDREPDYILFEGCKTKSLDHVRVNYDMRSYNSGVIRIAQLIYEP